MSFKKELIDLLNSHSLENGSHTPDWILAEYLTDCLKAFDTAQIKRDEWYGYRGEGQPGVIQTINHG